MFTAVGTKIFSEPEHFTKYVCGNSFMIQPKCVISQQKTTTLGDTRGESRSVCNSPTPATTWTARKGQKQPFHKVVIVCTTRGQSGSHLVTEPCSNRSSTLLRNRELLPETPCPRLPRAEPMTSGRDDRTSSSDQAEARHFNGHTQGR